LAAQQVGEDRAGGLRDRASPHFPPYPRDRLADELDLEADLAAAGGAESERFTVGLPAEAVSVAFAGVCDDDLLVEFFHRAHAAPPIPKNGCTRARCSRKASRSSTVLYTCVDTRAEACTPSAWWIGCAQWCPTRIATPALSRSWPTSWGWTPSTSKATVAI